MAFVLISALNAQLPPSENYVKGVPAMGFQYDAGAMWAALCKNTPHGTMPGKFNPNQGAFYPWGEKEHSCYDYELVFGKLAPPTFPLPEGCQPKGFQYDAQMPHYNVLIYGAHGLVPGKANDSLGYAFYAWGGKEWGTDSNFYVIC